MGRRKDSHLIGQRIYLEWVTSDLTIFIDEGGDSGVRDGLRFQHSRHEWFSVGAYVVRTNSTDGTVALRDRIMGEARVTQTGSLHYYKLKPDRRLQVCTLLGAHSARAFCLLSHKANLRNYYNEKLGKFDAQKLFNWCSRLLIERIMEFAALDAKLTGQAIGPATFIFSENKGHDYDHMRSYFGTLEHQATQSQMILKPKRWVPNFLVPDRVLVKPHDDLAGLQLADVIASAFLQGANSNANNHDPAPAVALRRIMAKDGRGRIGNCGVTLWPLPTQGPIPETARPLFKAYGYKF